MAIPRNSVEHRYRVLDDGQDQLFLRRFWLKLVPFLTETKVAPSSAEAVSKYDSIQLDGFMMTPTVELAQRINPNLLVFRKFNAAGYRGFTFPNPCTDSIGVPFGSTGPATTDCAWHAGHWVYYAGTRSSQAMTATSMSVVVADAKRVTPGRYVVIYDAPAGSFRNAEHALVKSVSGNTVTFSQRGFKSIARSHPSGAILAEHPVAGSAKGTEEPQHWMYNMSSACPIDSRGNQLTDTMATWLAQNIQLGPQSRMVNLRVDGVMFDTDSWSVSWRPQLDVNNDLVADGGWDSATGTNLWGEGTERFYQRVRDSLPHKLIVGGDRVVRGFESLNGTQMEGWPVSNAYHSATPEYRRMDELLSKSVMHLREGPQEQASFVENFSKTPTKAYPYGVSPAPKSNAPFRFAFGTALLDDGYFGQELSSDTRDPWWDEFAVDVAVDSPNYGQAIPANPKDETLARVHRGWLGLPLGPRERVYDPTAFVVGKSLIANGGLNSSANLTGWQGTNVDLSFVSSDKMAGTGSMRISKHRSYGSNIASATVKSPAVALKAGVDYTLVFSAKAQQIRSVTVNAGPSSQALVIPDYWVRRVVSFTANTTGNASIVFQVGQENVAMWLDEVHVFEGHAGVFKREFEQGLVVVNTGAKARTVALDKTYLRIKGTGQDPINDGSPVTSVVVAGYDAAILVASKPAPKPVVACGAPTYSAERETAMFIYNECNDPQTWHARFTAGGQSVSYRGSVTANRSFNSLTGTSQEASDILNPAPFQTRTAGPIDFVQNVGGTGWDGFSFNAGAATSICVDLASPTNRPIMVGVNRVEVSGSIDLVTLKPCR
jgi:hypothetical protein